MNRESRLIGRDFFCLLALSEKQFQLLPWGIWLLWFLAIKELNIAKLLVCDTENANLTKLGKERVNTFQVYVHILTTDTMSHIDAKLKHSKTIFLKILAEIGISLFILLGFGW